MTVRDNFIDGSVGLLFTARADADVHDNTIIGFSEGVSIRAAQDGTVTGNDISGGFYGLRYGAPADVEANLIHGNVFGVNAKVAATDPAFGAVGHGLGNIITGNTTGVTLDGRMVGQIITGNAVGVTGSGTIGGDSLAQANEIERNTIGIDKFRGTVEFNRIDFNATGINATSFQQILDNTFSRNTDAAILVSNVHDVRIGYNAIYSATGDAVRIVNGAVNAELVGNILWADSGYDIFVGNDAESGFYSNYNDLYFGDAGKLGFWTKDFRDILDWQADIARFDLNSVGRTVLDADEGKPRFANIGQGDFRLVATAAGQTSSNQAIGGGDPLGGFDNQHGVGNLLVNPGFENGLQGWNASTGAAARNDLQGPYSGAAFFSAQNRSGQVTQRVDLVAAGYSGVALDSGTLEIAFGGRVFLPNFITNNVAPPPVVTLTLIFRDANGTQIANASVVTATQDSGRWQRLDSRLVVPVGARSVDYSYAFTGTFFDINGPSLDDTFLSVIPRGATSDLGPVQLVAETHAVVGGIALRSPDLYVDWELNKPRFIEWDTSGAAVGQAVRIELWQDGPGGPAFRAVIAQAAPDSGQFIWIPSSSGLDFGTHGLRIKIFVVGQSNLFDLSTETFTVPEAGHDYWVDDQSNVGDEFTPDAIGSNRNTGKLATAPKPNPVNLLRVYDLTAGDVLHIDTGNYPLISPVAISGAIDLGLGHDEGFSILGPTNTSTSPVLFPANPFIQPAALVELDNADFMTIRNLTLIDGQRGLWAHDGSDTLNLSFITESSAILDGIAIDTLSPNGLFDHLTASGNGSAGLRITGVIGTLSNTTSFFNTDGVVVDGTVAHISDGSIHDNAQFGMNFNVDGQTTVEGMHVFGNSFGVQVRSRTGDPVTFGNADLTLGRGNVVFGNRNWGVTAGFNTLVVGNTISNNGDVNQGFGLIISGQGTATRDNVITGNAIGINASNTGDITENLISGNTVVGLTIVQGSGTISRNVFSGDAIGARVFGDLSFGLATRDTFSNNVFANDGTGLQFLGATQNNVTSNTFYNIGIGIDLGQLATNNTIDNNIIAAVSGIGIAVANSAQSGLVSNFNLFSTGAGGRIGTWQGIDRSTLKAWRTASFTDANSLEGDPAFVNPAAGDFHVQSQTGAFVGGTLGVFVNPVTGLPVKAAGTLQAFATHSKAIDRGDAALAIGLEPAPNGGFVEIGAYGGTQQASLSLPQFIIVSSPDGGEFVQQGRVFNINWRSFAVAGAVDIDILTGNGAIRLATGTANDGQFAWTPDPAIFPVGTNFQVRVSSSANPAINDTSDNAFSIVAPTHTYYVDDTSNTGDQYTPDADGNDANDGLTPFTPKATIQSVLATYALGAGDTILVDTGLYNLTTDIVFTQQDSGTADDQRLIVQGATNGQETVFFRNNTASNATTFRFSGADFVTLDHLVFGESASAVFVDDNSDSRGITVSNVTIENQGQAATLKSGAQNAPDDIQIPPAVATAQNPNPAPNRLFISDGFFNSVEYTGGSLIATINNAPNLNLHASVTRFGEILIRGSDIGFSSSGTWTSADADAALSTIGLGSQNGIRFISRSNEQVYVGQGNQNFQLINSVIDAPTFKPGVQVTGFGVGFIGAVGGGVINSDISGVSIGVRVIGGTNVSLIGDTIHDVAQGVLISSGGNFSTPSSGTLVDLSFIHDLAGDAITSSGGSTIRNNRIQNNGRGITGTNNDIVSGNTVSGSNSNQFSFGIDVTSNAKAINNVVFGNSIGIQERGLGGSVIGNRVFNNSVEGICPGHPHRRDRWQPSVRQSGRHRGPDGCVIDRQRSL